MLARWRKLNDRERLLRFVQPSLVGLLDGSISTLAPVFAAAYLGGSHTALFVGLAASLGAAISMGLSEGLSDDGVLTGRGAGPIRGLVVATATFIGGIGHTLPFLIGNINQALVVAYVVVTIELIVIAMIRKRYLDVNFSRSMIQVTCGGIVVALVGILLGQA